MNTLTIALMLAFQPPPNIPLPPEAEYCIVKAELCVEQQPFPNPCAEDTMTCTCKEGFETCAQFVPELHELSCRLDYVWCLIEPPDPKLPIFDEWQKGCELAFTTCPTFPW